MKILLTGGSGYLGTSLKQELRNRGDRVFSLSRSSGPHIDDLACDLTNMSEIDDIFKKLKGEKIKVVVHLASKLMDETLSQSDIFDHLLASLPIFDLRAFQLPSDSSLLHLSQKS